MFTNDKQRALMSCQPLNPLVQDKDAVLTGRYTMRSTLKSPNKLLQQPMEPQLLTAKAPFKSTAGNSVPPKPPHTALLGEEFSLPSRLLNASLRVLVTTTARFLPAAFKDNEESADP